MTGDVGALAGLVGVGKDVADIVEDEKMKIKNEETRAANFDAKYSKDGRLKSVVGKLK